MCSACDYEVVKTRVYDPRDHVHADGRPYDLGPLQSHLTNSPIRKLVLTGGGSRLSGLAARLGQSTRLEVQVGNPLAALEVGKTGLSPEQIAFVEPLAVVPVGLALGAA